MLNGKYLIEPFNGCIRKGDKNSYKCSKGHILVSCKVYNIKTLKKMKKKFNPEADNYETYNKITKIFHFNL